MLPEEQDLKSSSVEGSTGRVEKMREIERGERRGEKLDGEAEAMIYICFH